MSTPEKVPEEIEMWISMWLFDNVVSGPGDYEIHNAKVIWARAIALALYYHIGRDTSIFDGMYKLKQEQLTAARNEINDNGVQIAKLLAELKRCQENLTATIEEALQKSKEADAYRKMLETLKERGSRAAQTGRIYTPTALWINDLLEKYPSPPTNKDIQ